MKLSHCPKLPKSPIGAVVTKDAMGFSSINFKRCNVMKLFLCPKVPQSPIHTVSIFDALGFFLRLILKDAMLWNCLHAPNCPHPHSTPPLLFCKLGPFSINEDLAQLWQEQQQRSFLNFGTVFLTSVRRCK